MDHYKEISKKLNQIKKLFEECEQLSFEGQVPFSYYTATGNLETYHPKKSLTKLEALEILKNSETLSAEQRTQIIVALDENNEVSDSWNSSQEGWNSSY